MKTSHLLLSLYLLLLYSCRQNSDAPLLPPTDHSVLATSAVSASETKAADSAIVPPPAELVLDTANLSPEPETPLKLLLEGSYHKNEVWGGAERKSWLGLIKEEGGYVLHPTTVQVNTVEDPVADSSGVLSGREVVAADSNVVFLLTGLQPYAAGTVDTATFHRATLPANRDLIYTFKGGEFRISAYGDSVQASTGEYGYQNYGWKVAGTKKGKKIEQTLSEHDTFDDSIYVLLWAGDLDRDGIPDLLVDLSNHYNVSSYTLFLSSKAAPGKLYKKVALFEVIGC